MSKSISTTDTGILPDYSQTGDIGLKNQDTLRRLVGVLGMSLPLLLYISLLIDTGFTQILPSISHYYYTRSCGIFLIIISLLSFFLIIYKGEEFKDFIASSLAGLFSLVLLLFPTNNLTEESDGKFSIVSVTTLNVSEARVYLHYFSAGIFLFALAYMSYFLFTKSKLPPNQRPKTKKIRNGIYRTCAVIMVAAILVMFSSFVNLFPKEVYDKYNITFWMEIVALEAFGFSWMIKGDTFFTDKK